MNGWLLAVGLAVLAPALAAQQAPPDSARRDSLPRATLDPVTVTVSRAPAALWRLPFAVATLDGVELARGRATAGLDEALALVPGVVVSNRYNYALDQRISIRGFGARSAFGVRGVKVLLDGIPQTLPDGQGQLNGVEPAVVERVEILRGPSSSLHGNASGGVISLSTDLGVPERAEPTGRVTAGAFGFRKWMIATAAPIGTGALHVTGSRTLVDGHREHSAADVRYGRVHFSQLFGASTRMTVLAHLTDMPRAENPGALTAAEFAADRGAAAPANVTADARKAVTQFQGGASIARDLGGGGSLDVAANVLRRDLENPLTFAAIDVARWAYGVRTSATLPTWHPGVPVSLTVGVDAQRQRDDRLNRTPDLSAITLDQLEWVTELGPFVQAQVTPHPRVTVTGGVRYDRVSFDVTDRLLGDGDASGDEVMDAVSWSLGVALDAHPVAAPYASVATAFETPTTTELVNRPEGGGGLNPGLEPQRATNYEVGVRGRVGALLDYRIAAFQADVEDGLIPFEVPSEPGRSFFRNVGASRHRGVEVDLTAAPAEPLVVRAVYTYSDYRFRDFATEDGMFDGNRLPGVPEHRLYWSLRAAAPLGLWAALDDTHASAMFADDANTAESAGWRTTDVRLGWTGRFGRARVEPFVGILNVFDEHYASSVVVNAGFGRYFEPAPGRNAYFGLEVELR